MSSTAPFAESTQEQLVNKNTQVSTSNNSMCPTSFTPNHRSSRNETILIQQDDGDHHRSNNHFYTDILAQDQDDNNGGTAKDVEFMPVMTSGGEYFDDS